MTEGHEGALVGRLPAPAARVARRAGAVAERLGLRCALVGGSVRDLLLGRAVDEVDLAVEGDLDRFAAALAEALGGRLVERSRFATRKLSAPGCPPVDLAGARRETYPRPGALPVVHAATLEEDLRRRDVSVNALAIVLREDGEEPLLDPFQGLADLRAGRLRVLHARSFEDDPTRAFRAARLAARLGFSIEPETRRLLGAALAAGALGTISPPRRRRELAIAAGEMPLASVALAFADPPLLAALHPALAPGPDTARVLERLDRALGAPPGKPVVTDSAAAGAEGGPARPLESRHAPDRLALVLGALLQAGGEAAAEEAASALALAGGRRGLLLRLAGSSSRLASALAGAGRPSAIVAAATGAAPEELLLAVALNPAAAPAASALDRLLGRRPALTGDDLDSLGVPPGPLRRLILARVRDAVLDGLVTTPEEERQLARDLAVRDEP